VATKNITIPDVGGATDVDVLEVLVKVGDSIKVDTPLLTLESDKATMEVPSMDEGVVKEIKIKTGDKVSTGTVILTLETKAVEMKAESTKTVSENEKKVTAETKAPPKEKTSPPAPILNTVIPTKFVEAEDVHAGPLVRRIAREFGIPLTEVPATGPKNRILKEDIQTYVKTRLAEVSAKGASLPTAPAVDFAKFGEIEAQALSRINKLTGKNLHRNWLLVPHVTQFGEADITELEEFRLSQKKLLEKQGIKMTPLVFIMKAVVASLKVFPKFNASLDSAGENLIMKKYFHIGVAVDTADGLVVPVIRDVDKKGLQDLAKELNVVSEKARAKQLSTHDMQGGCFSISSLGGIGGSAFTPIVNVPEVAILGVSKASKKPIYKEDKLVPRMMLPLSLSYDHRVIDGAEGARFIVHLSDLLANINTLLL
jgi:pyruvate dehydrogenase E2 component (dihydrolipoamide acetyltransferase)